ncbi:PREDICTED: location of vulva defective 1-like isoform X1 [Papilio xuthus]|uniref:Location of vulva defective 1-like isoform X1 n=1 Tax=Papilio xuthus TaxID=66420 RepID=A0AAJ7E6T1_PAPXU|nr:PREDICTED: location of vulva defective 1-like isoform X1 [Papilio xuthus]
MRVCVRWRGAGAQLWCALLAVAVLAEVASLSGPNVCMVKQKYNITKRVKYRAPMSVRTYEWCFSMPPRCSRWSTEMRDLTRLETEERTAEVAVCCPGYKMKDVSCVPICPYGKTGPGCSDDCPENKWGPNCVYNCSQCAEHGGCSPLTGDCECEDGWQGESCEFRMSTTQATTTVMEKLLTTSKPTTITNPTTGTSLSRTTISNASTASSTTLETSTVTPFTSEFTSSSSTTSNSPKSTTSTLATSPKETPTTTEINLTTRKIELENLSGRKNIYESVENFESTTLMSTTNQIRNYENITITTEITSPIASTTVPTTTGSTKNTKSIYNRTEISLEIVSTTPSFDKMLTSTNPILTTVDNITKQPLITTTEKKTETYTTRANIFTSTEKELTTKLEATKRHETTTRTLSTVKFKPKEIWIKPTQKGESTVIDFKIKTNHESVNPRNRIATKKESSEFTTPRTIIVSIIPTSVSYATFKKIALTTSSYLTMKNTNNITKFNKTEHGFTSSMASHTSLPPFIKKIIISSTISKNISTFSNSTPKIRKNVSDLQTNLNDKDVSSTQSTTNSMVSMEINNSRLNLSTFLTTISTSTNSSTTQNITVEKVTKKSTVRPIKPISIEVTTRPLTASTVHKKIVLENITKANIPNLKTTKYPEKVLTRMNITETKMKNPIKNVTKFSTKHLTTKEPDDETFHILTEPEHITAVMNEKERDRTSMDLISVVSIAGGVMMAVITVAVLIVMVERCRRPRFEQVRKVNDIRMQVTIDNNDAPPPYTRSIFHTPLPEPPSDKCHYQPISTLDRNLKQFMRPVVVQNISPIMLENFRGILECHYDHLPRRNHDFGTMPSRFAAAPSMSYSQERYQKSRSVHDSTIDALKCEAKLDAIDASTSEPLYAEIPCWRPPSEHAIEVLNLNGEAITEL